MFTPQRKAPWTPATSTPRTDSRTTPLAVYKGKAVAYIDGPPAPPPPLGYLGSDSLGQALTGRNSDDWKKFKEAGLLDELALGKKDHEALLDKVSRLETELFDYQYNMGLLLIEKNNLAAKTEEMGQQVSEVQEILKREQAAHLITISEAGKREDNLKRALDVEKKCVIDYVHLAVHLATTLPLLERAVRDMREEHTKIKDSSEGSVADVNARIEMLEQRSLELEGKSHSVNARLAEADRKTSELDRQLQDLETRESILKRERLTLTQEREAHESYFQRQKEDLLEWERKLKEAEQRFCDSRRTLNEREEKLHETDRTCKQKEIKLQQLQQKIDLANATLKKMESEINNQSAELELKEKKAEALRCDLEMRENQLKEKEEGLNARETVELQKLLNEHKSKLDAKMHEFEFEMKHKRKSVEEELKSYREDVCQKESEINHLEMKLGKREQALEKKAERAKEKEKDVEAKAKTLKEQEKCLKAEEKKLEAEKKQLNTEKERLENLKDEIEGLRTEMRKQQLQIEEERTKLTNAEEERLEYLRLQSCLKQETENVRRQSEVVVKEAEDLRLEREKFEKDWEALDDKRAGVDNELKTLAEEKTRYEKLRSSEEESLKKKYMEAEQYIQQERESLRLEKESFEATMKHEKLMLFKKAENEHSLMHQDYEQRRQKLHHDMQKRQNEWEKMVEEKERAFEEMRLREMRNINHLKENAEKKKEEMETERRRMEKEMRELEVNKQQLEETSIDISKDIEALDNLSKKLKNQREELIAERANFGALIEKIKRCTNCGDFAQTFLLHDLQLPTVDGSNHLPGHSHDDQKDAEHDQKVSSVGLSGGSSEFGGKRSIFRRCASIIFRSPPNKGIQDADDHIVQESPKSAVHVRADEVMAGALTPGRDEPGPSFVVNDSLKNLQRDVSVEGDNVDHAPSVDDSNIGSEIQDIQEPEMSDVKSGRRKPGRKRGSGVRRTRSVKAVVEEAKAFLGESSEGKMAEVNGSAGANARNLEIAHADMALASGARKRSHSQASRMTESEQDIDYSDGRADSVTTGGRRKRRQTVSSALPTPRQRRYNLRHHTTAATASAGQEASLKTKKGGGASDEDGANQPAPNPETAPSQSLDVTAESDRRYHLVQVSTTRSVEFSSDKIVRFDTAVKVVDSNVDATKSVENTLLSGEVKSAENMALSEEVNGTSENVEEDDNDSIFHENEDDNDREDEAGEDDDDDDDDDHPGQASIGNKLWKFFTT